MNRIIGHRGWAALAPENTEPGFLLALNEEKIWAIECDIHLTKDGQIVVAHDPYLGRCCNGTGWIKDYTYSQLLELDFGSWFQEKFKNTKIMLLSQLLQLIGGKKRLVCEIKSYKDFCGNIEKPLLELTKDYPSEMLCFKSFDHTIIKSLHQLGCKNDLGLLFMDKPVLLIEELQACGCNFVSMFYANYDQHIFDLLRKAGMDCYAWTVDSKEDAQWLFSFNNHEIAIITNNPDLFIKGN